MAGSNNPLNENDKSISNIGAEDIEAKKGILIKRITTLNPKQEVEVSCNNYNI
jgi:hypothetical protein